MLPLAQAAAAAFPRRTLTADEAASPGPRRPPEPRREPRAGPAAALAPDGTLVALVAGAGTAQAAPWPSSSPDRPQLLRPRRPEQLRGSASPGVTWQAWVAGARSERPASPVYARRHGTAQRHGTREMRCTGGRAWPMCPRTGAGRGDHRRVRRRAPRPPAHHRPRRADRRRAGAAGGGDHLRPAPGRGDPARLAPARSCAPPPARPNCWRALGADAVCVLPFTLEFSRLGPEEFVHSVLVGPAARGRGGGGRELPLRAPGGRRRRAAG